MKYILSLILLSHVHVGEGGGMEINNNKYQPSGAGGTRSPPATPHCLQYLTACFIQNGRRGPVIG